MAEEQQKREDENNEIKEMGTLNMRAVRNTEFNY